MSDQRPPIIRLDSKSVDADARAAAAERERVTAEVTERVVNKVAELTVTRTALEMQGKSKGDPEWDAATEALDSYLAPPPKTETSLQTDGRSSRLTPPRTDSYGRSVEERGHGR